MNQQSFGEFTALTRLGSSRGPKPILAQSTAEAGFARLVVIKQLFAGPGLETIIRRLQRVAQIDHPSLRRICKIGRASDSLFVALEYLEGVSFAQFCRARRRTRALSDPRLWCTLLTHACEGIHHAHKSGLLHGSLDPTKLFVTCGGLLKVLDLGLSDRPTDPEIVYTSPEHHRQTAGPSDDIYALGVIAWEAFAGRRIFTGTRFSRRDRSVPRLSRFAPAVPRAIADAVSRAMAVDPSERFTSARELGFALEKGAGDLGGLLSTVGIAAVVDLHFARKLEDDRRAIRVARERLDQSSARANRDFDRTERISPIENPPHCATELRALGSDLPDVSEFRAIASEAIGRIRCPRCRAELEVLLKGSDDTMVV